VPELPEVETVVRDLRPLLVGRRLSSVQVGKFPLRRHWSPDWEPFLVGTQVRELGRRGKWIVIKLANQRRLVIHLGMTGNLTVEPRVKPLLIHTHLVLGLDRGKEQLRFRDIRRFGSATVFPDGDFLERFFAEAALGPEPFEMDLHYWRACLSRTNRCLKAILLDQRVVAGIGNIYADESLFAARLHPAQLGRDTSPAETQRLRQAIVKVLCRAIDQGGSSIRNYVGGSGLKGRFQDEFSAYGRTGGPCPRCRTPIVGIRLAGRATHFCPRCQPVSRQTRSRRVGRKTLTVSC
jgi:formamidopyrimidine-DNA glycosylase